MSTIELGPGEIAPDFTLPDQNGVEQQLSDLKGKWVVLYFYPKDDTSGCTLEARDFTDRKADFEARNAVVVGISPDDVKSHRKFCDKHGLDLYLLADPGQEALKGYGVWQEKSMYGRTYMGVVRSTYLIAPDGTIANVWRKVKVKGHADEVLAAIK